MPKVWHDVAQVIHYYEAVLATLAILVWHAYWVVFDPGEYPMNPSWLIGTRPAHRAQPEQEAEGTGERPHQQHAPSGPVPGETEQPFDPTG